LEITTMTHTLFIRDGEAFREASSQDILDRAAALMAQSFRIGAPALEFPDRTRQYLRHQIGSLPYEVFGLLLLDNRHRLIRSEILFRGTIDGASVHRAR
jgi:DNA repair protein RadC